MQDLRKMLLLLAILLGVALADQCTYQKAQYVDIYIKTACNAHSESNSGFSFRFLVGGRWQKWVKFFDRSGDDMTRCKGDWWHYNKPQDLGIDNIFDIQRFQMVANGNDGWGYDTLIIMVTNAKQDRTFVPFHVSSSVDWIDGDGDKEDTHYPRSGWKNDLPADAVMQATGVTLITTTHTRAYAESDGSFKFCMDGKCKNLYDLPGNDFDKNRAEHWYFSRPGYDIARNGALWVDDNGHWDGWTVKYTAVLMYYKAQIFVPVLWHGAYELDNGLPSYYFPKRSDWRQAQSCFSCSLTQYKKTRFSCAVCPNGKTNSELTKRVIGVHNCKPCPNGMAGTNGACKKCSAGKYTEGRTGAFGCVPCPSNKWGVDGKTCKNPTPCKPWQEVLTHNKLTSTKDQKCTDYQCTVGDDELCLECAPLQDRRGTNHCKFCNDGYYVSRDGNVNVCKELFSTFQPSGKWHKVDRCNSGTYSLRHETTFSVQDTRGREHSFGENWENSVSIEASKSVSKTFENKVSAEFNQCNEGSVTLGPSDAVSFGSKSTTCWKYGTEFTNSETNSRTYTEGIESSEGIESIFSSSLNKAITTQHTDATERNYDCNMKGGAILWQWIYYVPFALKEFPDGDWGATIPTQSYYMKSGADKNNQPNCPIGHCNKESDCVECELGIPPFDENRTRELRISGYVFEPLTDCPGCTETGGGATCDISIEIKGKDISPHECLEGASDNLFQPGERCEGDGKAFDWDICGQYDFYVFFGIDYYGIVNGVSRGMLNEAPFMLTNGKPGSGGIVAEISAGGKMVSKFDYQVPFNMEVRIKSKCKGMPRIFVEYDTGSTSAVVELGTEDNSKTIKHISNYKSYVDGQFATGGTMHDPSENWTQVRFVIGAHGHTEMYIRGMRITDGMGMPLGEGEPKHGKFTIRSEASDQKCGFSVKDLRLGTSIACETGNGHKCRTCVEPKFRVDENECQTCNRGYELDKHNRCVHKSYTLVGEGVCADVGGEVLGGFVYVVKDLSEDEVISMCDSNFDCVGYSFLTYKKQSINDRILIHIPYEPDTSADYLRKMMFSGAIHGVDVDYEDRKYDTKCYKKIRVPTPEPSRARTPRPTQAPIKKATRKPTPLPTKAPTKRATGEPTPQPTMAPIKKLTKRPTRQPTPFPTETPTEPCDAKKHCNGNGITEDQDSSDGCDCICLDGFGGSDCSVKRQDYSFSLWGKAKTERVSVEIDGRELTQTLKQEHQFVSRGKEVIIEFTNDGCGRDVFLRSQENWKLEMSPWYPVWQCGTDIEHSSCQAVRDGMMLWGRRYKLTFEAVGPDAGLDYHFGHTVAVVGEKAAAVEFQVGSERGVSNSTVAGRFSFLFIGFAGILLGIYYVRSHQIMKREMTTKLLFEEI